MRVWLRWTLALWCLVADLLIFFCWFHVRSDAWVVIFDAAIPPFMLTICACFLRLESGRWP